MHLVGGGFRTTFGARAVGVLGLLLLTAGCGQSSPSITKIARSLSMTTNDAGRRITGVVVTACGPRKATATNPYTFEASATATYQGKPVTILVAAAGGTGGAGSYRVFPMTGALTYRLYLVDTASPPATSSLQAQLQQISGVENVLYKSKDQVLADVEKTDPDLTQAIEALGTNPLPAYLDVTVRDVQAYAAVDTVAVQSPLTDQPSPPVHADIGPVTDARGIGEFSVSEAGSELAYASGGSLSLQSGGGSFSVSVKSSSTATTPSRSLGTWTGTFTC